MPSLCYRKEERWEWEEHLVVMCYAGTVLTLTCPELSSNREKMMQSGLETLLFSNLWIREFSPLGILVLILLFHLEACMYVCAF